jgi:hypothetical protein
MMGGRSLGRYDDGLQKASNGFADHARDDEVLERLEKPVGTAKRCFRVKVVGSNPAGPTKKPGFSPTILVAKIGFSWIRRNWHK